MVGKANLLRFIAGISVAKILSKFRRFFYGVAEMESREKESSGGTDQSILVSM